MKLVINQGMLGGSSQWSGWLGGLGSLAPVAQNLINVIGGIITALVVIFLVYRIVIIGIKSSKAETPEEKKTIKTSLMWYLGGIVIIVIGATVVFGLLNTIGKVVQKNPSPSTLLDLQNLKYVF